jgi:hypothetical protein
MDGGLFQKREETDMKQYETFELCFSGDVLKDRWAGIAPEAEFSCGETVRTVKGFYDGEGRYMVRFLPETAGEWHWKVTGPVSGEGTEPFRTDDGVCCAGHGDTDVFAFEERFGIRIVFR